MNQASAPADLAADPADRRRWPMHLYAGLLLMFGAWLVNWPILIDWAETDLRTHILFFPLWLGYCLTVDAMVVRRRGHSPATRSPMLYVWLFVVSMPGWWLFEVVNWRTQNWFYTGEGRISGLEYLFFSSLCFSTVIPAVFGTAELVSTFGWVRRLGPWVRIGQDRRTLATMLVLGWLMLGLLIAWPNVFYPFVWGSVFFILEPINVRLGNRGLTDLTRRGDYRPIIALFLGCLICGFFWEMWNFYSQPKWTYRTPGAQFLHVFEMPLLGFLGYLPFALELFALYHLVTGLLLPRRPGITGYVQFADVPTPAEAGEEAAPKCA